MGTQELTSCVGRNLTSFMAFQERKQGGSNRWRGNYSPEAVRACDLESNDSVVLTWFYLVREIMEKNGGKMSLKNLYEYLEQHPKAKKNQYYKERIHACIYEHRSQFQTDEKEIYRLAYAVE